jgi:hypothetical protein
VSTNESTASQADVGGPPATSAKRPGRSRLAHDVPRWSGVASRTKKDGRPRHPRYVVDDLIYGRGSTWTGHERAVAAVIASHLNKAGTCWPKVGTIVRMTGFSEGTVDGALKQLCDKPWSIFSRVRRAGWNAGYEFTVRVPEAISETERGAPGDPHEGHHVTPVGHPVPPMRVMGRPHNTKGRAQEGTQGEDHSARRVVRRTDGLTTDGQRESVDGDVDHVLKTFKELLPNSGLSPACRSATARAIRRLQGVPAVLVALETMADEVTRYGEHVVLGTRKKGKPFNRPCDIFSEQLLYPYRLEVWSRGESWMAVRTKAKQENPDYTLSPGASSLCLSAVALNDTSTPPPPRRWSNPSHSRPAPWSGPRTAGLPPAARSRSAAAVAARWET